MDALELVLEAVLEGDRLLGELHPRGVGAQRVRGAVAGAERAWQQRCHRRQRQRNPHTEA